MKSITIRLEDNIHKNLKMKTVADDTTIQDKIVLLIKEYLESEKNKK